MNITFRYSGGVQCSLHCVTPHEVPGTDVNIDSEKKAAHYGDQKVVKQVPCGFPLLVDTCLGHDTLKIIDSDCSFFVPSNEKELSEVKPLIKDLMQRRVFVLKEVQRPDISKVKEECRRSFYSDDGSLKNRRFECPNLSPQKMADAGLRFVGHSKSDEVECYTNNRHAIDNWKKSDHPVSEHIKHYGPVCLELGRYNIPVLSSASGDDITGEMYKFVRPDDDGTGRSFGRYCGSASLVTRSGLPIKRVDFKTIAGEIDSARLGQIEKKLQSKLQSQNIDPEYCDLLREKIKLGNFSGLLREFVENSREYTALLREYRSFLDDENKTVADTVSLVLSSGAVEKEIDVVVERLANLEVATVSQQILSVLPENLQVAGVEAVKRVAVNDLVTCASSFSNKFFVDESLNSMMATGRIDSILGKGHLASAGNSDQLFKLLEKGGSLAGTIVSISEKIHDLLTPFNTLEG